MIYFIQLNRGGNNGLNYVIHWIQTPFSLDYNTKINIFLKYTTHAITCCYNIFHMLLVFSHLYAHSSATIRGTVYIKWQM